MKLQAAFLSPEAFGKSASLPNYCPKPNNAHQIVYLGVDLVPAILW